MKIKVSINKTALELICQLHQGISKLKAKKMIKSSTFLVNGEAVKTIPSTLFKAGLEVEILRDTFTHLKVEHPNKIKPIVIKYEDDYFIVAIKPVGLLSCKSKTQRGVSFDQMLNEFVSKRDQTPTRLWIAHRIDREVEGLIIFAKSEKYQKQIKDYWKNITKKYLAITENVPSPESGFIEGWLKEGARYKMEVAKKESEGAVYAKTQYHMIKKLGKYSLVEITLHTGKKNQIRAHLASIDCPIVGDFTYGADKTIKRQIRLVAYHLDFFHPILEKSVKIEYRPKNSFYKPSQSADEVYK
jgi:23S rRNA pseudouridine1911/1915/1917 synthase